MKTSREILIEKKIKVTSAKVELISLLSKEEKAYSFPEIMKLLARPCHKTSLYRILAVFVSHSIVDRIMDAEGMAYFIFNGSAETTIACKSHTYFKCICCGNLKKMPYPKEYYQGYCNEVGRINSVYLIAEGICNRCCQSNQHQ
jgi:Fe2+ or Zn2+ uptake regulation protein